MTDPVIGSELYALDSEAPTANPDTATVMSGQSTAIPVLANDTDTDGSINPTTVTIVSAPAHGTATVGSDGTITYTAASTFSGTDTLTYSVQDNQGLAATTPGTVTIQISPSSNTGSGGSDPGGGGSNGSTGSGGATGASDNSGGSGHGGGGTFDLVTAGALCVLLLSRGRRRRCLVRGTAPSVAARQSQ